MVANLGVDLFIDGFEMCIRDRARETAVKAFSLSRETKMLSTTLYRAWTSMEIIKMCIRDRHTA